MSLTRSDCLLLLSELNEKGIDTTTALNELSMTRELPTSVLKFINDNRQLDVKKFYEKLRKSYNDKKSTLYKNIVKEIDGKNEVLTTLASLQLQILLFCKAAEDVELFMKNARLNEISYVLSNYSKTYDITNCIKLLRLIKADLKALESL